MRSNGRSFDQLREIKVIPNPQKDPAGSVLIQWGRTHVMCSIFIDEKVPHWMGSNATGWITAEYGMLPGCSDKRIQRDKIRSTGRTHEIQRLIGRSIRASMDMKSLGLRTIQIDCDVIQADGGTRVASITGAYLALRLALQNLKIQKSLPAVPQSMLVSAVSLGKVKGKIILDLEYTEDVQADVDANVVMNEKGEFIEVQGTAEKGSFSRSELEEMTGLAQKGCEQLFEIQRRYLTEWKLI